MVNFLLKVFLRADDLSGPDVETSHHTSLYMGWMMGLEVEIPVRVCGLPVDRDVEMTGNPWPNFQRRYVFLLLFR